MSGQQTSRDVIENYFFFSSMDDKEIEQECPIPKKVTRTHYILGMHKFELMKRLKSGNDVAKLDINLETNGFEFDSILYSDREDQKYETYVKLTTLLQCDPKLSRLKQGLYKTALPNFTK